jgi:hypothetical protein
MTYYNVNKFHPYYPLLNRLLAEKGKGDLITSSVGLMEVTSAPTNRTEHEVSAIFPITVTITLISRQYRPLP